MATRINTRFVLVLIVCVVSVAAVVLGLWAVRMKNSTERHIRMGDAFMEAGEYREAYKSYGRAVNKKPNSLDNLERFETALMKVVPTGRDDARELYSSYIGILRNRARYHPLNAEYHLALLNEITYAGRVTGTEAWWEQVALVAQDMLDQMPESDPQRVEARLFRAMATYQRAMVLTEDQLDEADADADQYLEARPDSDLGWAMKIAGRLARAQRIRSEGIDTSISAAERELAEVVEAAKTAASGPETTRAVVVCLAVRKIQDPDSVTDAELRAAVDRLIQQVAETDDPMLYVHTTEILRGLAYLGYADEAVELLDGYVARHPDALHHRTLLVDVLFRRDELDTAEQNARQVIEAPMLHASVVAQFQDRLQRQATALLVDIAHRRWELAESSEEREALVDGIASAVADLRAVTLDPDEDPLLARGEGKLAVAGGDYRTAAARFDRLARSAATATPEVLFFASRALEQTGEPGLAYERMAELQMLQPTATQVLYDCARLSFLLRAWEQAEHWLDALDAVSPGHPGGLDLASRIAVERRSGQGETVNTTVQAIKDAERALIDGETDSARATLLAVHEVDPEDVQIIAALLQVEMSAGESEAARRYLQLLLERQPRNPQLLSMQAALANDDPVEAIRQFVESTESDPGEQAVALLLNFSSLAESRRLAADRLEAAGDAEAARRARELASRAEAAAEAARLEAARSAPDQRQFLDFQFREAMMAEDWDAAERIVQRARETDADLANGLLFEGRLALVRGNAADAARLLTAATERAPHSSVAWKALAAAYERVGNFGAARTAFETAYRNNPNDVETVRRYVGLLNRMGEQTRALRVMRQARRLLPDDERIRDAWLDLESDAGDPKVVIKERLAIYESDPDERANAMALATFLATTEPTQPLMRNDRGELMFSDIQWGRMTSVQRQAAVAAVRSDWHDLSDAILDELESAGGDDMQIAVLRARLLRERGEIAQGEQSLRDFIDRQGSVGDGDASRLIALATYLADTGREAEAVQTLNAARNVQNDQRREADIALGDLHFALVEYEKAAEAYARAAEMNDLDRLQLRVIECYAKMARYDEARRRLDAWMADGHDGYFEQMLAATIADGMGEVHAVAGRLEDAEEQFALRDEALDAAEELSPSNPQPYIERARALLRSFNREVARASREEADLVRRRSAELDRALVELERAEEIRTGNDQTSLTRAAVLQAKGDLAGAIGELQRLLERVPDAAAARRRMAQLQYREGDLEAAQATVQAGRDRNPLLAEWPELSGDLYLDRMMRLRQTVNPRTQQLSDLARQAATAYRAAANIDPTPAVLSKLVSALLSVRPPDYQGVIQSLDRYPEVLEGNITVGCLYARALSGLQRRDEALDRLRAAWAVRGDSDHGPWHAALEVVFYGRPPAEIESFVRDVVGGDPGPIEGNWLATIWSQYGPDGASRALELQQQAVLDYRGTDPAILAALQFNLANVYIGAGRIDAAVAPLQQTLVHAPNHVQALNNYAYILSTVKNEPDKAIELASRARDLLDEQRDSPDLRSSVLDTVGWTYRQLQDLTRAELNLRQSVEIMETASNCYHLARVLADSGDLDRADTYNRRAAELRPDRQTRTEIDQLADDIRTKRRQRQ